MRVYLVGGAVRDGLLGLAVSDCDFAVVGATPEEMTAAGFRPVGADFPVFVRAGAHYALARTERKRGRGHKGFVFYAAPDVSLACDLRRRDFTINALARAADGALIDPCGGRGDLEAGVLRHISDAFGEDPLRVFRAARLSARLGFAVAAETRALLRRMSESGETDALAAERVWNEIAAALRAPSPAKPVADNGVGDRIAPTTAGAQALARAAPSQMFRVLADCGVLARTLPEVSAAAEALAALDEAARMDAAPESRFAALLLRLEDEQINAVCRRLRAPQAFAAVARAAADLRRAIAEQGADGYACFLHRALVRLRAFHGEDDAVRMEAALAADRRANHAGRLGAIAVPLQNQTQTYGEKVDLFFRLLPGVKKAARSVDAAAVADAGPKDSAGRRVREARIAKIAEYMQSAGVRPQAAGGAGG